VARPSWPCFHDQQVGWARPTISLSVCIAHPTIWLDEAGRRDTVIATDHLILAAKNEGLATCWVGAFHDRQVKKIVNVPDEVDDGRIVHRPSVLPPKAAVMGFWLIGYRG